MQKRRSRRSGVEFVRFYPGAWRNGCALLSLEEEALYLRICAFRWDTGHLVPSDRSIAAKLLRVQILKYRKLIDGLIAQGLVEETADGLIVERAEIEFRNAAAGAAGNAPEAVERTARKTVARPIRETGTDTVTAGYLDSTPTRTPTNTPYHTTPVEAEKIEQNQRPVSITKNKTKNNIPTTKVENTSARVREADRPSEEFSSCKSAFNGATEAMLAEIERAMGYDDRRAAERWLATTMQVNGAEPVAQAFAMLATARAENKPIASVLRWWSKTAAGLKAGGVGASKPTRTERSEDPYFIGKVTTVKNLRPAPGSEYVREVIGA